MKILHIFDHSVPLHSGYAFRSQSILKAQRARGWETIHLTSPKQGPTKLLVEDIEGLRFLPHAPGSPLDFQIRARRLVPAHACDNRSVEPGHSARKTRYPSMLTLPSSMHFPLLKRAGVTTCRSSMKCEPAGRTPLSITVRREPGDFAIWPRDIWKPWR